MKILVTGGLGFIGHNVVAMLESIGHEVVITDNQTTYGIIPQQELDALVAERRTHIQTDRIYRVDIADKDGIDWLVDHHDPDVIIHLASFPRQKVVNASPQAGSRAMSEGLLNLLESCSKRSDRRFVYISSSMVYGNFKNTYFDGVDESHTTNPIGQYGIMKLAGEWLVRDYTRRTGMSHVILRPSAVYGPRDVEDRVVSKFLTTAMQGGEIQVNGREESLDFTYVTDCAAGIVVAAIKQHTENRTYNISRGHARTLLEAAELAVKIAGGGSIRVNTPDGNFPSRGQLNTLNAKEDFGFEPEVNIEQGFKDYYEWLKNSVYGIKKAVQ
jgi:nucleoside-diphosphate-sugar epimerase